MWIKEDFFRRCGFLVEQGLQLPYLYLPSMTMNPLPPQAYTQDTVNAAYQWLTKQPQTIREMASSVDMLVHLYLKAKRHGDEVLERPSIQNFTKELKSLAGMMGEFEPQQIPSQPSSPSVSAPLTSALQAQAISSVVASAAASAGSLSSAQNAGQQSQKLQTQVMPTTVLAPPGLDEKSQEMIQKVKENFNLSSDAEVLRLLISTGYHHVMKLKDP